MAPIGHRVGFVVGVGLHVPGPAASLRGHRRHGMAARRRWPRRGSQQDTKADRDAIDLLGLVVIAGPLWRSPR